MSTQRDLQLKIDIANARLREMEQSLGKKHNAVKIAKHSIAKTTGRKTNNFFVPRNASEKQLKNIEHAVDALLASTYSTPTRRRELREKTDEWLVDALGWEDYEYTEADIDAVYNVLGSKQFQKFKELYIGSSDLEIEIIGNIVREKRYKPRYIKGMLTRYMKKGDTLLDARFFE